MLDCLIIGDSIAVGAHQFRPECASYSKSGVTSQGWDRLFGGRELVAGTVIISLGTNDWAGADTYAKLREIREKITGGRVFWIAPNEGTRPRAYKDVNLIAGLFGDTVIVTERYQKDRIHPSWAGYRELVEQTK